MSRELMHDCALPACATRIAITQVMCLPHWEQVPRELKRAVILANRRGPQAYRIAVQQATAAVAA